MPAWTGTEAKTAIGGARRYQALFRSGVDFRIVGQRYRGRSYHTEFIAAVVGRTGFLSRSVTFLQVDSKRAESEATCPVGTNRSKATSEAPGRSDQLFKRLLERAAPLIESERQQLTFLLKEIPAPGNDGPGGFVYLAIIANRRIERQTDWVPSRKLRNQLLVTAEAKQLNWFAQPATLPEEEDTAQRILRCRRARRRTSERWIAALE